MEDRATELTNCIYLIKQMFVSICHTLLAKDQEKKKKNQKTTFRNIQKL